MSNVFPSYDSDCCRQLLHDVHGLHWHNLWLITILTSQFYVQSHENPLLKALSDHQPRIYHILLAEHGVNSTTVPPGGPDDAAASCWVGVCEWLVWGWWGQPPTTTQLPHLTTTTTNISTNCSPIKHSFHGQCNLNCLLLISIEEKLKSMKKVKLIIRIGIPTKTVHE